MIEIIGAPFDRGGREFGSRLGPAAIRLADVHSVLRSLGIETSDLGDVRVLETDPPGEGFVHFAPLLDCVRSLQGGVRQILERGSLPLVLGGEHTLVVGGISAALELYGDDLALIWIDAHADVQTPSTSTSGNIHGMPLAALLGLKEGQEGAKGRDWNELLDALGPTRLPFSNIAWYALRDVDPEERERVKSGFAITMHDIDRHGIEETVRRLDGFIRGTGAHNLWISFDVDALDPFLAPGTGTAVRGGLSYREAHLFAELLRETLDRPECPYRLAGIDVVETNPLADTGNETATMAVEWVASLLGKRILG